MCVYSMVMEHYIDKWYPRPWEQTPYIPPQQPYYWPRNQPEETAEEKEKRRKEAEEAYKKLTDAIGQHLGGNKTPPDSVKPITSEEIEEFRKLLDRAREYDKRNNEPDCENDQKKELLKQIAQSWGFEIDFL